MDEVAAVVDSDAISVSFVGPMSGKSKRRLFELVAEEDSSASACCVALPLSISGEKVLFRRSGVVMVASCLSSSLRVLVVL